MSMNVGALLTKAARSFGERLAISHGADRWTYAEFNARVNRLAGGFTALGVARHDTIALLMYNGPQMLEAMFAAFKAGCGVVPINFRLHPDEFAYIIDHSEAKVVVASAEFGDQLKSIASRISGVRHIVIANGDCNASCLEYETLLSSQIDQFDDATVAPDDLAWLFYTSGTTGRPKGAMLTHRNLLAMSMSFYADMCPDFGPDDVTLHVAPLSHGSGLYALPNVGKAAANIFLESRSFEPSTVLKAIEEYRVTNMFAAPTIVQRMVDAAQVNRYDLSSLKALIYGGAPMLVDDLTRAMAEFGGCLVQLYGQGETPMTITYLPHQDHVLDGSDAQTKRLGSVGIPRTNVEVTVVDKDERELAAGQMGEIVTRSDVVMKGYWRDAESSGDALKNGWLHTGDVGYRDEDGYLFLVERSKDLIISGGENIYPREVEEVLIQHPGVREVAVIGVPDAEWGEAVKAVVAPSGDAKVTETELIEFCRERIASYKKPKSVEFINELPKNNYGKILKRDLRTQFAPK